MKNILLAILTLTLVTLGLAGTSIILNDSNFLTNFFSVEKSFFEEETNQFKTATSYETHIEKGQLLTENGYYTLAITEFSFAAQEKPQAAEPYNLIGNAYASLKNYEKALENYEKAFENIPTNTEAILGIAQNHIHLEEFQEAREALDGFSDQSDSDIKYYQGMLYAYDGEYERSEGLFEEVATIEAQYFLDAYYEYNLEQGGQETHLRTLLAQAYTEVEQFELAISTLYEVLSENASYRDAWILLGYAYLNLEEYENSTSAFEQAIELDVTKPESNYFLALAYFGQDRHEETITYLELSILYGFEPQIQAYQKLAEVYFLLEDYESSARNYEQVLELNDSDLNYFIRPIWLNIDYLDNPTHALELAEWAIESHPGEAMSYNLKGWVLIATENYEEASDYLNQALTMDPDLAAAYLNLGTIAEAQGNYEEAKENYRQAYTLDQNDSVGALAAEKYNNLVNSR